MLALVGSGEYLPGVDPIDQTLIRRLPEPARVVCLPTAAGREGSAVIQSWMQKGVAHFTRLGAAVTAVPVVDAASARDPAHAAAVQQANFVYLSGGHPGYLQESLAGSPVWQAVLEIHQRSGVVAGCSAGAMIMGARIVGPGGIRAGFGLLPGTVIVPHFDEFPGLFSRAMRLLGGRSMTMIGIDGRTALVISGNGGYEVLGSGQVTIVAPGGTSRHAHGALPEGLLPAPR